MTLPPIFMFRMGLAIDAMSMGLLKYIPTKLLKELDQDSCDSLLMGLIMSRGEMKKCGVCKKFVECDETDEESRELFKKDFPTHDYKDSGYVCWDCYNKAMKKKDSQFTSKEKNNG